MANRSSCSRACSFDTVSSPRIPRFHTQTSTGTCYLLAYPAPVYTDKTLLLKHLVPRRFLQLQKISEDGRHHEPVVDVMSLAPPKNPRRFMSVLKNCLAHLRTPDKCLHFDRRDILLVMTGQDSALTNDNASAQGMERVMSRLESLTQRKVLAVLRAKNRIVTEDGRVWVASVRPNGSFEFTSTDKHGDKTVARWVPAKHRRVSSGTGRSVSGKRSSVRSISESRGPILNFSLMKPTVRRHPVLATLTPSSLHIKDTYHQPVSVTGVPGEDMGKIGVVDEPTKMSILATAVWIDLHLRWSPSYG